SWPEFRPMLEDLAEELAASCADGTLPRALTVDQVWLLPDGRVQLLAAPLLGPTTAATRDGPATVEPADATVDDRALRLLRDVAVTALEGRPRLIAPARDSARAPVPVHAAGLLDGLFGSQRYTNIEDL